MKRIVPNLKPFIVASALVSLGATAFAATPGVTDAKVSMPEARAAALKAYPGGKIMKEELEKESGGSGLRYSFDMKHGKTWREIGIDAETGKLLENAHEGANPKD